MKGVPRSTKISKAEFLESLYNSEANSDKKMHSLIFLKKNMSMCLVQTKRRSLNAAYSKMRVLSDLRTCEAWE